jgi:hypothetical protein
MWLLVQQVPELQVLGWLGPELQVLVPLGQPRQKRALEPDQRGSSLHS